MADELSGNDYVLSIERNILAEPPDVSMGRRSLLRYLRGRLNGGDASELSIAEILEESSRKAGDSELACVVLRCLSVDGVIPDKSVSANISRSVVDICQKGAPTVCKFIRLNPSAQTFEKYRQLSTAHAQLTAPLQPFIAKFADIDSAVAMQRQLLGALDHGVLNIYAEVFGLSKVRMLVDEVFSKLRAVAARRQSLADDIQACWATLKGAEAAAAELHTFLSVTYLTPFLVNIGAAISDVENSLRDLFSTSVTLVHEGVLPKRYPLHELGRTLRITIPFTNAGPGKLVGLKSTVSSIGDVLVRNERILLGDITPGRFSIVIDVEVCQVLDYCKFILDLEWDEIGSTQGKSDIFEIEVRAQSVDVDWTSKEFWAPYSTEPAQGTEFVGRLEKVKEIASKVLRTPMEPFYITGQKRVGKTSLAVAGVTFAELNSGSQNVHSKFVLWGDIAYQNPLTTIKELGALFEDLIRSNVDLRRIENIDCSDSLAPLIKLCHYAYDTDPLTKFVFVIDEFDEVHQELYLHGSLAETFFANLRALTRCRNVCLALIGGENMPYVMDRQGQKLNNFARINLNYYKRDKEWEDFKLLVTEPAKGVISWHDDAISEVFNITNGNPYFAKIVCANVLRHAVSERDADVSYEEVRLVVAESISSLGSNYFAHLWQDGIPKPIQDREPEILARARVLVGLAQCLRQGSDLTSTNIGKSKSVLAFREGSVAAVLNDFVRREVLDDRQNVYRFLLPLFSKWLEDVGVSALAESALSKELADSVIDEEQALMVKSDEIVHLVKRWPTFRGRHVDAENVRAWLNQVSSMREQRILFKILQRLNFFTDVFIREKLETIHNICVLPNLDIFVRNRASDRRRDVIVTYVDGEGKSGQTYASYYAEQNLIAAECIVPPGEFAGRFERLNSVKKSTRYVVIVDDLAATGKSLAGNVIKFLQTNSRCFDEENVGVLVCTVASTREAATYLEDEFRQLIKPGVEFRTAELLGERDYAFSSGSDIWADDNERDVAKSLCTDLGVVIYGKRGALGYGGLGLLLVFPNSIPNNDLPILHSASRVGEKRSWVPLFPRITH